MEKRSNGGSNQEVRPRHPTPPFFDLSHLFHNILHHCMAQPGSIGVRRVRLGEHLRIRLWLHEAGRTQSSRPAWLPETSTNAYTLVYLDLRKTKSTSTSGGNVLQ